MLSATAAEVQVKALSRCLSTILLFVAPCWGQVQRGAPENMSIVPILDVLARAHVSGSLEYSGSCDPHRPLEFPGVTKSSGNSNGPLQTLREMFANEESIRVTQDSDGTIRMRDSDVPRDLLDVKIANLSFDNEEKKGVSMYSPVFVLNFVTAAPEVQAFMKNHNIQKLGAALSHEIVDPDGSRVTGELNNVTLSQALDYIMKTFPGLWVYERCPDGGKSDRAVVFLLYRSGQRPSAHTAQR